MRILKSLNGFTLIEMALVLLVITVLLGGLLVPLGTQMDQRNVTATQKRLDEIKESLIGYALINGRLPRPATSFADGTERTSWCTTEATCTGFIPWATLAMPKLDSWGKIFRYSVTPDFANGPITFSTLATKKIRTRNSGGSETPLAGSNSPCNTTDNICIPAVIFSHGKSNWGTGDGGNPISDGSSTNVDEDANNTASVSFFSRVPSGSTTAGGGEFDDIVTWVPQGLLISRLVAAQRLP